MNQETGTSSPPDYIAAVDIGSNSLHLIVARIVDDNLQPLVVDKQMVRLAEGLEDGVLSEEAMQRGFDALKGFEPAIRDLPIDKVRVVGTYTLREAKNRLQFVARAHDIFPVPVEIISGDEEARLIYQGVAHTTPFDGRRLVIDIGGGSTEFVVGENFEPLQIASLSMGSELFRKKYFASGEITKNKLRKATLAGELYLELIERRFKKTGWQTCLGSSGSVKAMLRLMELNLPNFDGVITLEKLKWVKKYLLEVGHVSLIEGMEGERHRQLPAAYAIMRAAFNVLGIESMQLATAALREGVLFDLSDRISEQDIRQRTVQSLMRRYSVDGDQVERIYQTASKLLDTLKTPFENLMPQARQYLRWAIDLHEIGLDINPRGVQRHSAYIIANAELAGFSLEQKQLLTSLVGNYRKRFSLVSVPELDMMPQPLVHLLLFVLRISALLNVRRLDGYLPDMVLTREAARMIVTFPRGWLAENKLVRGDLEREQRRWQENGVELCIVG